MAVSLLELLVSFLFSIISIDEYFVLHSVVLMCKALNGDSILRKYISLTLIPGVGWDLKGVGGFPYIQHNNWVARVRALLFIPANGGRWRGNML